MSTREDVMAEALEAMRKGRNRQAVDQRHLTGERDRLAAQLAAAKAVLAVRERELLELKGPCSAPGCRLHYTHSGPCDTRETR